MNIDRVSLTKEEAQWFARYVLKMIIFMENAGKKDPKILDRTTYRVLSSLRDKAEFIQNTPEVPVNDINCSRKQKLLMQDLIGGVLKNLTEIVIPEYRRRTGHDDNYNKAEGQATFLTALIRKFRV